MSPRLRVWGACRALAVRSRPAAPNPVPFYTIQISKRRLYSDDAKPPPPNPAEGLKQPEQEPETETTTSPAAKGPEAGSEVAGEPSQEVTEAVSAKV